MILINIHVYIRTLLTLNLFSDCNVSGNSVTIITIYVSESFLEIQ